MKPSVPKGTRDFSPEEMNKRNHIFETIKQIFRLYGYQQIETPAMEQLSTLTGKYGEEGDQLLFKILNSRIHESSKKEELLAEFTKSLSKNTNSDLLTERALRYDLTVPFARYVVMHQHEITFPFKRFQIQPVWRADRPQKGRYREFFQCDADVIGSDSLMNEVELVSMTQEIFRKLGIEITIKINNRKILSGIAELIGTPEMIIDITVAIDKLDKIGKEKVIQELETKGLPAEAIHKLDPLFDTNTRDTSATLAFLKNWLATSDTGMKGIAEIESVLELCDSSNVQLDITLARGLNYYTGAIFEVKANNVQMGSICGGGRYDDLTGIFGLPNVSGVGISFGIDRIYDVMDELRLWNSISNQQPTMVLLVNFGAAESKYCLNLLKQLRNAGISSELYPDSAKMKKQMGYADANRIPFVIMAGSDEIKTGILAIKNMHTGEQTAEDIITFISKLQSN